jgi:O-antigen/teichoic acid export membrane protein
VLARNWLELYSLLPGVFSTVLTQVILIPRYGAVGAGWSYLIGGFVSLVFSGLFSRRLIPFILPVCALLQLTLLCFFSTLATALVLPFLTSGKMVEIVVGTLTFSLVYASGSLALGLKEGLFSAYAYGGSN